MARIVGSMLYFFCYPYLFDLFELKNLLFGFVLSLLRCNLYPNFIEIRYIMNRFLLIASLMLLNAFNTKAQDIHSPSELFAIMAESSIMYELGILEEEVTAPDRSNQLNYNNVYRVVEGDALLTKEYKPNLEAKRFADQAERLFRLSDYIGAREQYKLALEADPSLYYIMTYIGQTYGMEKNFEKAVEWYKKSVEANYIDYMAHWFMADAYKELKQLDEAIDAITTARILNRINPRIYLSMKEIYKLKKVKTPDWTFNPQLQLDSVAENTIKISVHEDWFGYGVAKALWTYDTDYRKKQGAKPGSFSSTEEIECIIGLLTSFDKKRAKKDPMIKTLNKAIEDKQLIAFIFYEIILPKHPYVAYQLNEQIITDMKDYVIKTRGRRKG